MAKKSKKAPSRPKAKARAQKPAKKAAPKKTAPKNTALKKAAVLQKSVPLKTVPVKSAPAVKSPAVKSSAVTALPVKASERAPNIKTVRRLPQEAVPEPALPARQPTRKIFGAGNTITIVPNTTAPKTDVLSKADAPQALVPVETSSPAALSINPATNNPAMPQLSIIPRKVETASRERDLAAWSSLPENIPASLRYLIASAERECACASSWPFPFAKFIAALPQEICGVGLALQILSRSRSMENIAALVSMEVDEVEAILVSTRTAIEDRFFTHCREIYRKWTSPGVAGKSVDSIAEQSLLVKIDKNFQLMIAELVLNIIAPQLNTVATSWNESPLSKAREGSS